MQCPLRPEFSSATLMLAHKRLVGCPIGHSDGDLHKPIFDPDPSLAEQKMPSINEHIFLEISRYLGLYDLLSLAHVRRLDAEELISSVLTSVILDIAFMASHSYSFWNPHEFIGTSALSAFLPKHRLGPWKSYSGEEIRISVERMCKFKHRWIPGHARAIHHLSIWEAYEFIPYLLSPVTFMLLAAWVWRCAGTYSTSLTSRF